MRYGRWYVVLVYVIPCCQKDLIGAKTLQRCRGEPAAAASCWNVSRATRIKHHLPARVQLTALAITNSINFLACANIF
jgi:hypothetical protein